MITPVSVSPCYLLQAMLGMLQAPAPSLVSELESKQASERAIDLVSESDWASE